MAIFVNPLCIGGCHIFVQSITGKVWADLFGENLSLLDTKPSPLNHLPIPQQPCGKNLSDACNGNAVLTPCTASKIFGLFGFS